MSGGSYIDFVPAEGLFRRLMLNKWLKIDLIDFRMHYKAVLAADRVPRSFCHDIMNLPCVSRRRGSQKIKPSELGGRSNILLVKH